MFSDEDQRYINKLKVGQKRSFAIAVAIVLAALWIPYFLDKIDLYAQASKIEELTQIMEEVSAQTDLEITLKETILRMIETERNMLTIIILTLKIYLVAPFPTALLGLMVGYWERRKFLKFVQKYPLHNVNTDEK